MTDTYLHNDVELAELVQRSRLTMVLVRYRGRSEGRFIAPAQDVQDLTHILIASKRYIRDMSYSTDN